MEHDEALEKIRERKLQELMKKADETKGKKLAADRPIELDAARFKEAIQNHPLLVVDCWAAWCGPCRMVAPIIDELAREYASRITFAKLNVDENQSVALEYQIMSIPTLLVFKNGKFVDRIIGALPKSALESKITQHL